MSAWDRLDALAARQVDRVWGETFDLVPRRRPPGDRDARYQPDPTREPYSLVGRFDIAAEDLHARSRATSVQTTRAISAGMPTLTVHRTHLRGPIIEGDLLTRAKDATRWVVGQAIDGNEDPLVYELRAAQ